uniref:Uncharacterized protein n=1 Tax=Rhizophora mucronata TaxID=61149 RepID=A0A2P2NXV5_RHIMU
MDLNTKENQMDKYLHYITCTILFAQITKLNYLIYVQSDC